MARRMGRGDDARQLGLPHADAHERLQGEAQHLGGERAFVRLKHPGLLEARHPRLDGVAGKSQPLGERDDGDSRVFGQGGEQFEIDTVKHGHSATR